VETVAQEAPLRGIEDLLPARGQVFVGDSGHLAIVKRTFA
jgi:hypothetical protein